MKSLEQQLDRYRGLTDLIRQRKTGRPEELAAKLGVSKRNLYVMLDCIRSLGVEISYSKKLKTYWFSGSKELFVQIPLKVIVNDALQ